MRSNNTRDNILYQPIAQIDIQESANRYGIPERTRKLYVLFVYTGCLVFALGFFYMSYQLIVNDGMEILGYALLCVTFLAIAIYAKPLIMLYNLRTIEG